MNQENKKLDEAAHKLYEKFGRHKNTRGIGVRQLSEYNDKEGIVVYVKGEGRRENVPGLPSEIDGFPIKICYFGDFAPLGQVED